MKLPGARCVYSSSGRLRLRIPDRKGDGAFFARARDILAGCPGVAEVNVNPLTGSILLYPGADLGALSLLAAEQGLFRLSPPGNPGNSRPLSMAVRGAYRLVDGNIRRLSGGNLNLPETAVLTLAGGGVYQLLRGKVVALPWYVAFWYALSIYLLPKAKHHLEATGEIPLAEPDKPVV